MSVYHLADQYVGYCLFEKVLDILLTWLELRAVGWMLMLIYSLKDHVLIGLIYLANVFRIEIDFITKGVSLFSQNFN